MSQQSAAMSWSKQLLSALIMEMIDAHKAGKGDKKIAEEVFQVSMSSFLNVIKKWQLPGAFEVMIRSERPRKTATRVTRTETQNPHLTVEELQEGMPDSWSWFIVELFSNTCTKMDFMEESSEENLSCVLTTKFSIRSLQNNIWTSLMHFASK